MVMLMMAVLGGVPPAQAEVSFCPGLMKAVGAKLAGREAAFIRSYEPAADEEGLPLGLSTTAFVYDNALAAIALVACGHVTEARAIGNALVHAASHDRTFDDGRLRNAYRAGAVGPGAALLPGWWDNRKNIWGEDAAQDGTSTGNVAWAALALLTLHRETGEADYLSSARRLMDWIIANASNGTDGFSGGFHGYDPQQVRLTWMSTEHNADVHVWVEGTAQAALAYRMTGNSSASERLLAGLRADRTPTGLLNATRSARLTTGLSIDPSGATTIPDFFYYKRPHLGATAWAVLAETGWNPFTGARVP